MAKRLFYYQDEREPKAENRIFSNFYASPIEVEIFDNLDENGRPAEGATSLGVHKFETAEHLFQVLKFFGSVGVNPVRLTGIIQNIKGAESPDEAKKIARTTINKNFARGD